MSLLKNSSWNILGFFIPIAFAIPAMGVIARQLGVEGFGLFTLAYAVVGYASIFDAGLSRAVIRYIAIKGDDPVAVGQALGSATCFVFVLSIIASSILFFSAENLTEFLSVSKEYQSDSVRGFKWLSLVVAPFLLSLIWFSYLEGKGDFFKLNLLKGGAGIAVSLFPVAFVVYESTFEFAIIGLLVGRLFTAIVSYLYGLGAHRSAILKLDWSTLKSLLEFSGWLTVSNILSPVMVYFDRFFISSVVGAQAVAFYTVPAEAIARLLLVPMAVARVLFPRLSAKHNDAESQAVIAYKVLSLFNIAAAILIYVFAEEILHAWVGASYTGDAVIVLRVLVVGFVFNSMAQIPYTRIQAAGHSKLTAVIHLSEVVPYLILLYFLTQNFSLVGAAAAWSIRVSIDYLILELLSRKMM